MLYTTGALEDNTQVTNATKCRMDKVKDEPRVFGGICNLKLN